MVEVGCGDACPILPGKTYLDWRLDDPAGKGVHAVRPIRDDVRTRVEDLLGAVTTGDAPAAPENIQPANI